jgi:hypothetical protein
MGRENKPPESILIDLVLRTCSNGVLSFCATNACTICSADIGMSAMPAAATYCRSGEVTTCFGTVPLLPIPFADCSSTFPSVSTASGSVSDKWSYSYSISLESVLVARNMRLMISALSRTNK